jgi:hypothetical protein
MKKVFSASLVVVCLGVAGTLLAGEKKMAGKMAKDAKLLVPAEMQWNPAPDNPGISVSVLWGDPAKGGYGAIHRWAGGTKLDLHSHTHDVKAIIVSGTLRITLEGKEPKDLVAASYLYEPGGVKHVSECVAGADCVFFVDQHGAFDTIMTAAPSTP